MPPSPHPDPLHGRRLLIVVGGGIGAYKVLELIRRLRERGAAVRCLLTAAGARFVTPLSLSALSEDKVYSDLFDLTDEAEMGHIQLSRQADLIVVTPATADLLAKMAAGLAGDLATAVLLATDKDVLVAPAMNVRMWSHPATRANLATLRARGVAVVGPAEGAMACGEFGLGRLAEVEDIISAISSALAPTGPLAGRHVLVTSGPTHEPIDPARIIANRSSGRQGAAIATALARLGARVTLVSGPTALADPPDVRTIHVETAREMLAACEAALPADAAICAAAVADWRVAEVAETKLKKDRDGLPTLKLVLNPDILAQLCAHARRPALMAGFAAETEDIVAQARAKRKRKGCDWILANDVSGGRVFGAGDNQVHLITANGVEPWPPMSKTDIGARLADRVAEWFA